MGDSTHLKLQHTGVRKRISPHWKVGRGTPAFSSLRAASVPCIWHSKGIHSRNNGMGIKATSRYCYSPRPPPREGVGGQARQWLWLQMLRISKLGNPGWDLPALFSRFLRQLLSHLFVNGRPREGGNGWILLELGVHSCEPQPCGVWELNPGALDEQQTL